MRIDRSKTSLGEITGFQSIFGLHSIYSAQQNISSLNSAELMNDLLNALQKEIAMEIDKSILDKMLDSVNGDKIKRYRKVLHV
jgi:hypothetical protein